MHRYHSKRPPERFLFLAPPLGHEEKEAPILKGFARFQVKEAQVSCWPGACYDIEYSLGNSSLEFPRSLWVTI